MRSNEKNRSRKEKKRWMEVNTLRYNDRGREENRTWYQIRGTCIATERIKTEVGTGQVHFV